MRRDKRYLDIEGMPLLARAVAAVAQVCDEVVVVTSSDADRDGSRPLADDRRWIVDERPGEGPLAGIEVALRSATTDAVLVVAGDHPQVRPAVLRLLIDELAARHDAEAAMLETDRGPQPLLAIYRTRSVATITALLDTGERRARCLPQHLEVAAVDRARWHSLDPDGWTAFDLDTPQDVAALRRDEPPR